MGNVVFAVLPEILPVSVKYRCRVEINAGHFDFIHGDDQDHAVFLRELLHPRQGRAAGDRLGQSIPLGLLFGAEVRSVEEFLQAENLDLAFCRGGNPLLMLGDHFFLDLPKREFLG